MRGIHPLRLAKLLPVLLLLAACQSEQSSPTQSGQTADAAPASTASSARSCILMVGWSERPPFHYQVSDGSAFGIDIDVVKQLARDTSCALRFRNLPNDQLLSALHDGDVDMVVGAYKDLNNPDDLTYSLPYRDESYDLHVMTGSPVHRDDLEMLIKLDFDLGLSPGYSYTEPVSTLRNDMLHKSQFKMAENSQANVDQLLSGEVDGILEDPLVVRSIADRDLVEGRLERLQINCGTQQVHLVFNDEKVSADVIERFNQAIKSMQGSDAYATIVDRHTG
ncbi:MAG: transporter substrate-binding domain-containing protein [Wenzhouxiangellaceae bacterium]